MEVSDRSVRANHERRNIVISTELGLSMSGLWLIVVSAIAIVATTCCRTSAVRT
jgi:hypothetical protein